MKTLLLKNFFFSAAIGMLVASCASSTAPNPNDITKAAGDAAVDAATKNTDPLTGAAIRQTTGYGTEPTPTSVLSGLGL